MKIGLISNYIDMDGLTWEDQRARCDPTGEKEPWTESAADPCGVVTDYLAPAETAAAMWQKRKIRQEGNRVPFYVGGGDAGWMEEACGLILSLLLAPGCLRHDQSSTRRSPVVMIHHHYFPGQSRSGKRIRRSRHSASTSRQWPLKRLSRIYNRML
jgi:hypothetical protein